MDNTPEQGGEPANLRFLRVLVTILTASMIAGLVTIIALIVIRVPKVMQSVALPDAITLPDGSKASSFTQGPDWYAVVTTDDRILIFNRDDGKLRQEITIRKTK
ncbi:MAG: DUF6476 family protein [Paracoccaceae bacterium]|nr:DUF6476 family protein [Paracoccaceae bacterium]